MHHSQLHNNLPSYLIALGKAQLTLPSDEVLSVLNADISSVDKLYQVIESAGCTVNNDDEETRFICGTN